MRKRHVKQPTPTGDAELRLERLSATTASTTWYDISASGNNGTAADADMFSDFYFDGIVDEVLTASTEPSADLQSDWTLTFWYKRDTSILTGFNTLMQTRTETPPGGWILRDRDNSPALANYSFEIRDPYVIGAPLVVGTDADWHFAAIVYAAGSPNNITSYSDGVLFTSYNNINTNIAGTVLQIGKGNSFRFAGNIDTVRSYARTLSADEILRDYYAGLVDHQLRIVEENLVSQYAPQGMTPTAWADVTGSNNMTGAVTAPPAFDGDDYYTIGNPADLQFTNNWSVEAWASQSDQAPIGSAFERLISRDDIAANRCFILSQRDSDGFPFAGIFVGGTLKSVTGSSDYADGNYHHYVVTHDGATLKLYVDGVLEGSVATGGPMDNDPVNWEIGRAQNDSGYLNTGRVDTVRFYNATLSLGQIQQNYNSGLAAHS
jgi:hypothetical protein